MNDKIKDAIQEILNDTFKDNFNKKQIKETSYSYQFACPYCLDSYQFDRKKRAHLYKDSAHFHCYNCGEHKKLFTFLNDFGVMNSFSYEEMDRIDEAARKSSEAYHKVRDSFDNSIIFNQKILNAVSISKSDIKKHFNLVDVKGTPGEKYLLNRMQKDLSYFLYSKSHDSIWILNLTSTGKVLGIQIRVLKEKYAKENKYFTYSLKQLYNEMSLKITDDVENIDTVSLVYNLFRIDFNSIIKVLEGPFDALLLDNAIATMGTNKSLPFVLDTMVFIDDYDKSGKNAAIERITNGQGIFLWNKFLDDHPDLKLNRSSKIDLTNVIVEAKKNFVQLKPFHNYYTRNFYDLYFW